MKKFFAVAIALMMVLSLGVFAADYEVDIASITEASSDCVGEYTEAQFTGTVIKFQNGVGLTATLGEIDLSKYSRVIFDYGSDPTAYYLDTDTINLKDAEGNDLGSFVPSPPTGFWAQSLRTSEIALDTDYNGKVVLYSNLSGHGIAISNIIFIEKSAETEAPATEAETEAPATEAETEAPATEAETEAPAADTTADTTAETKAETNAAETKADDKKDEEGSSVLPIIIIVAVVAVAAVAVVVMMKKNKK